MQAHHTKAIKYEPAHFDNPINFILIFVESNDFFVVVVVVKSESFCRFSIFFVISYFGVPDENGLSL